MIMATGPLTGTAASTAGRYSVITKGALTNAIACSNSGGYFGAELKFAGWDMIIFEGKSPKPVYVFDLRRQMRDPRRVRHLGHQRLAHRRVDQDRAPGPDDAHLVPSASRVKSRFSTPAIVNDLHRAAGRSGVGAVMGSKNVKAVAVRGTGGVKVKDGRPFLKADRRRQEGAAGRTPSPAPGLPTYGTQVLMNVINEAGAHADPQPSRGAVRRRARHLGRSHGNAAQDRRQAEPADQPGLLRLHHRLRPYLEDRRERTSPSRTSRSTGTRPAASNTKPPGHSAPTLASTISKRSPTSTSSATSRAWTRSRSAPRSRPRWSCTSSASSPRNRPAAST